MHKAYNMLWIVHSIYFSDANNQKSDIIMISHNFMKLES